MAVYLGNNKITFSGISEIYVGSNKVYSAAPPDYSTEYFFVKNLTNSTNTLSIKKEYSYSTTLTVYYSTDKTNWSSISTTTDTSINIPAGSRIYLKCSDPSWGNGGYYNLITCSGNYAAGGNIMSLLYGDNFIGKTVFPTSSNFNFYSLFSGSTKLKNIDNLVLPATTLTKNCYAGMFSGCTGLTSIPSDLLPATSLGEYCYDMMFYGCTGITKAPDLPATSMVVRCYSYMFQGCSNLNEITCSASSISATDCTWAWVDRVAATGTFHQRGDAAWTTGKSGIPTGWTVIDERPYNPINDYFWVENRKSSSDTIRFTFITNPASSKYSPALSRNSYFFYYSTDKSTWTPHTATNLTIPANTRYYFYSNQNGGYNQRNGDISSGKAIPYFDSFGGIMAAASINGSFQPTLYANMGFGGNASSNFAIGGNIRTLLGKGTGGVGDTSLLERGSKQSISTDSRNQCRYLVYTALGTSSTSFSKYSNDIGLFFTGITDAGNLYIGNSDHEAEFSLITPTTLPIYT